MSIIHQPSADSMTETQAADVRLKNLMRYPTEYGNIPTEDISMLQK